MASSTAPYAMTDTSFLERNGYSGRIYLDYIAPSALLRLRDITGTMVGSPGRPARNHLNHHYRSCEEAVVGGVCPNKEVGKLCQAGLRLKGWIQPTPKKEFQPKGTGTGSIQLSHHRTRFGRPISYQRLIIIILSNSGLPLLVYYLELGRFKTRVELQ